MAGRPSNKINSVQKWAYAIRMKPFMHGISSSSENVPKSAEFILTILAMHHVEFMGQ